MGHLSLRCLLHGLFSLRGLGSLHSTPLLGVQRNTCGTIGIFQTITNQVIGTPTLETPTLFLLIQVNHLCKLCHVFLTWFAIISILRPFFSYAQSSSFLEHQLQHPGLNCLPWLWLCLKLPGDFLSVCMKETSYWMWWPTHCLIHLTENVGMQGVWLGIISLSASQL